MSETFLKNVSDIEVIIIEGVVFNQIRKFINFGIVKDALKGYENVLHTEDIPSYDFYR